MKAYYYIYTNTGRKVGGAPTKREAQEMLRRFEDGQRLAGGRRFRYEIREAGK